MEPLTTVVSQAGVGTDVVREGDFGQIATVEGDGHAAQKSAHLDAARA